MFSPDCANNCNQILKASLIGGDQGAISITSSFVIGTKYTFTVNIDFGRPYIGSFKVSIGVSQNLIPRYFGNIPTDNLVVEVNPQYLAAIRGDVDD